MIKKQLSLNKEELEKNFILIVFLVLRIMLKYLQKFYRYFIYTIYIAKY